MDNNTAPAANDDNTMPDGANDLGVELTEAQEAAFVDAQLGKQPTVKTGGFEENTPPTASPEPAPEPVVPPVEEQKPEDKPVVPPEPPTEEPVAPAEIPDVQTDDLWVEIEGLVLDDEGKAQAKTFKVTLADGIPEDMRFKNDKQLYEVMDSMREMRELLTQRQKEHDDKVSDQAKTEQTQASQQATLNEWQAEDDQLVEAGLLDAPKAPPANGKEYTAEEVAADPALQLRDSVYKYMTDENTKRLAEGKTKIASFATAFSLYNKTQAADADAKAKEEQEAKDKAQAELDKQRGSLVGGGSSSSGTGSKPYVYRAGSAKSIWAVPTDDI